MNPKTKFDWPAERAALGAGSGASSDALDASSREVLARYPASQVVPRIEQRWAAQRARASVFSPLRLRWGAVLVPIALAASAWLVVGRRPVVGGATTERDIVRSKGSPQLWLYRKTPGGSELLRDGQHVRAGELLQAGLVAGGAQYGVVVSIDGRGTVTLHWPLASSASAMLPAAGRSTLPRSYELDDAPGFERFFLVTAHDPLQVDAVLEAAHQLAAEPGRADRDPLVLAPGLEQTSISLVKDGP